MLCPYAPVAITMISTDRQAREARDTVRRIDEALSSEQTLAAIVRGLPPEAINGVRESLKIERRELLDLLHAYDQAKSGQFAELRERAAEDPGAQLVVARISKGMTQRDLARKLGLREQAIQRYEAERYRSISFSGFQRVARALGAEVRIADSQDGERDWPVSQDTVASQAIKVVKHAREHGWLDTPTQSDEDAVSHLLRYVGDYIIRHESPALLRSGMKVSDRSKDWLLLSWRAQVTRRAEAAIKVLKPVYRPLNVGWLIDLVKLSILDDGPSRVAALLNEQGIIYIIEPPIPGMGIDGASFLLDDIPVIGMTLLRDSIDNYWFTLLHEIAHIILHYRTGLARGFYDNILDDELDKVEREANRFAGNLLIPDELWQKTPARISKDAPPIERFAAQLGIHPAIVFGRIRMERKNYSLFSSYIGQGAIRPQLLRKT